MSRTNETNSQQHGNSETKKKSRTGIIIAIAVVIILILIGVILYLLLGKDSGADEAQNKNRVITPENVEEVVSEMTEESHTPPGTYNVRMTQDWVFPDGKSPSTNAYVANSEENETMVYFTIALADDGREIYKSPYLEVGAAMNDITLDTDLDAGSYDTVLTYHLVDDDFKEMSTVSLTLSITIEK